MRGIVLPIIMSVLNAIGRLLWHIYVKCVRRWILRDWQELEFAPAELRGEHPTVLAAVKQDWRALEYAAEELKGDAEIVHEAVHQSWRALRFASRELRGDRELVLKAVRDSNGWALEFAAEELYQDQELVREATNRLGGRLGLPLAPITTLVPVDPDLEEPGVVVSGSSLLEHTALPLARIAGARTLLGTAPPALPGVPAPATRELAAAAAEARATAAGRAVAEAAVHESSRSESSWWTMPSTHANRVPLPRVRHAHEASAPDRPTWWALPSTLANRVKTLPLPLPGGREAAADEAPAADNMDDAESASSATASGEEATVAPSHGEVECMEEAGLRRRRRRPCDGGRSLVEAVLEEEDEEAMRQSEGSAAS
eukprot:gnl/TRDRNA2_/TRDRNA2_199913_c0_seq1.p1 gnl/TRDRNA2_/TRDRNA2_199913_c0~~gnl/TRDRNA2_/TRDRNA2_199913_c0_seq1.p1  ORF type:complete len:371 (+),score=81.70 gnl/TRDRNA2_/TRDRNA2_199913_c0_seq1:131-1243(+)